MDKVVELSNIPANKKDFYIEQISKILKTVLNPNYPDAEKWFKEKVKPSLEAGDLEREALMVLDNKKEIIGLSILKNTKEEKKICTMWVKEEYRYGKD